MKYERTPRTPDAPSEVVQMPFSPEMVTVPVMEYPIPIRENFLRAARRDHPLWVPNTLTDIKQVSGMELSRLPAEGQDTGRPPWGDDKRVDFTDDFGCVWTYVPEAGGAMLKPNHPPRLDDITRWEEEIVWPDLSKNDYIGAQRKFLRDNEGCEKVLHLNIGQSCTERLVALLGGYTEAMVAMAEEPEAVKDFLMAFARFTVDSFQRMTQLAKMDFVTFHDDWGTEKNTFFSSAMMEQIVYEPTKLIIDAIKESSAVFELHSCGNISRFVPYMIDMGVDFIQLQRRANDVPALKEKYGDKIGFNLGLEGVDVGAPIPPGQEMVELVHRTIDLYAAGGGFYTMTMTNEPQILWDVCQEVYWYSREYYEG